MKLSKYEKETIILTNEEDRYYSVYTFNQGLQKCPTCACPTATA